MKLIEERGFDWTTCKTVATDRSNSYPRIPKSLVLNIKTSLTWLCF